MVWLRGVVFGFGWVNLLVLIGCALYVLVGFGVAGCGLGWWFAV